MLHPKTSQTVQKTETKEATTAEVFTTMVTPVCSQIVRTILTDSTTDGKLTNRILSGVFRNLKMGTRGYISGVGYIFKSVQNLT